MIDYNSLEALSTVFELQSFEKAAKKLFITQSAVSQRIKNLELRYGQPLLIRTLPYRLTSLGKKLLGHYNQVKLLENQFQKGFEGETSLAHFAIALNRDSLETWFLDLMEVKPIFKKIALEVISDDQELTVEYLKNGSVVAALSTAEKAMSGGEVAYLGEMEYLLVATPHFVKTHFLKKRDKKSLITAPALKFDRNDRLHERYLETYFGIQEEINYRVIPSVQGFKRCVLAHLGYALIPKLDLLKELEKGEVVELYPKKSLSVPLYWHFIPIESEDYKQFNQTVISYAKSCF